MNRNFRGLTNRQAEVFEAIAINRDSRHSSRTLGKLLQSGLIEQYPQRDGIVMIHRYRVPVSVHIEWCQWCSENFS